MHIAIDIHDITATGGLENVVTGLANNLIQRGHLVTCFTYSPATAIPRFFLNPDIIIERYTFTGD